MLKNKAKTVVKHRFSPCVSVGRSRGDAVRVHYRLTRDEHMNAHYIPDGEENIQEYINSFKNGCSLKSILDRIQLMPARDKISYLQQNENGFSADISSLPTDGTEAQIMLMKLNREHPDLLARMKSGESFDKVIKDIFGNNAVSDVSDPKPTIVENVQKTEVNTNGEN